MRKLCVMYLLLLPLITVANTVNLQIELPNPGYDSRSNGFTNHTAYGRVSACGKWQLPSRQINVVLPAGTKELSWQVTFGSQTFIPAAEPVVNPAYTNGEVTLHSRISKHTGAGTYYHGLKRWGDLVYASFTVVPAEYDEIRQGYLWSNSLSLTLTYPNDASARRNLIPPTFSDPTFFANPEQLDRWYQNPLSRNYDYLVVSIPALYNAAADLVNFRQGQGLQTAFADINSILNTSPGANNADKLRNFLIAEYDQHPFSYLLLIGDIYQVPFAYLTPEPGGIETIPSDFYFSDLTSNFDSDNDGRLGEYSAGIVIDDWEMDFTPELFVGRIPVNNALDVNAVCARIVAFENTTAGWKNNVLLPGAIQNFQDQGGEMDWAASDAADLMQYMKGTFLSSMQTTTMYEQAGILPSYPSDYPLDYDNFLNQMNTQSWGIVNWGAHGSSVSSSRVWWVEDNNNNQIPDNIELDWASFVNVNTFNNLANSDGAVFFLGSCYNGRIDNPTICLSAQIIKKKGVGSIAATRTGWYKIGWQNPGWGGLNSYNYHWLENYVTGGMSVGGAHGFANLLHTQYYLFGDPVDSGGIIWPELQNVYTYMLLGDPAVGYSGSNPVPLGEVLVWKPFGDPPYALINAINLQGNVNVIHTNKLIPDYEYLDRFEAIFCLFGYGQFVYIPEPGTLEYALLNSYLENGGKVWMEGLINWDSTDPLLGKFGTIAPYDHIVSVQKVGFSSDSGDMIWMHSPEGFFTQALVGCVPSAQPIFFNVIDDFWMDCIGIYNSNGSYRTIAGSFELNRLTTPDLDLSDMVAVIFDTLNVFTEEPVSNSDPATPTTPITINAYPNPFRDALNISIKNLSPGLTQIEIFNLRGQRVHHRRIDGSSKDLSIRWDGSDIRGKALAQGIYFLKLHSGNQFQTIKLIHLK